MKFKKRNDIVIRALAGDGIDCDNGTHKQFCSVGFLAKDDENFNYIGTAGHCDFGESAFYNLYPWNSTTPIFLGQLVMNNLEPLDFSLIKILNKDITPIPNIRNTNSGQYRELIIEDDIAVSSNGAHLCLSGLFSHVKCGYVEALNGFISNGNFVRVNILAVSMSGISGDSGGSIFSYKQDLIHVSLNGVLSGGWYDRINGGGVSASIKISSILSTISEVINITLLTAT
ncbi:S1 family peptidase [Gigaspora margarita]|uniref:S1 family peptidase n=1 Tax=Gigaspora margarita TaxID=4874 RepID=A0A8H4ABT9_GIGMA|nr:S1 family peptidase [Gigaspora margarita]